MCPFSVKFYKTMRKDVLPKFGDDMKLVVYNYVQTWHWTSAVMAKASIAAGQLAPSRYFDAFDVLADLREKYTEQEMTETTYSQIVEELGTALSSEPASIPKEDFIQLMDPRNDLHSNLLTEVKFHTKYGRQNSIHITPTVLINGLVDNSISSSMSAEDWSRRLEFYKAQKIPS
uniref:Thioredoxin-like fold domain-containing protein n=1 Tax=Chromera velia CCMP2878 TaxID=1169474 RepID=A0A0G4HKH1_9ALVE|eukprot:Cvel_28629.t1-p1 / transcript=Cvel_28629.t1 / gene=Cvel_28629 / organism=Chromera_velia_CCMP2878 / gene_product=hypothetical protein / transcript_product=hypothetical protein / location=Cvel_scaffold3782:542-4248(-) / protein_length=173 / sequence_SO=supercontig / SO=protein_coding / is_pseudo=false